MRAVVLERLGSPLAAPGSPDSPYRVDAQYPRPPLSAGSVRIRVSAGALNFADSLVVEGRYQEKPALPYVPGNECSGTVIEVGRDVRTLKAGDKVVAVTTGGGAFAEEVCVHESSVVKLPDDISAERLRKAAGLPVAAGTAWLALHPRAALKAGETLLVLGAGGGVGLAAVQLGQLAGARVVAVARGAAKAEVLRDLGADAVIDPAALGGATLRQALARAAPKRIDVIFDPVGGALQGEALKVANPGARLLVIGFADKIPSVPLNVALVKNLAIHGIYWGAYARFDRTTFRASLTEPARLFAAGDLDVAVSHTYALEDIAEAMAVMLNRRVVGKLIIVPRQLNAVALL